MERVHQKRGTNQSLIPKIIGDAPYQLGLVIIELVVHVLGLLNGRGWENITRFGRSKESSGTPVGFGILPSRRALDTMHAGELGSTAAGASCLVP